MASQKEIYEYVENVYRSRRLADEEALEARRKQAYAMSDELRKVDGELSETGARIAQCMALGGAALRKLKADTDALRSRKRDILKSLGLEEDFLDMKYQCDLCLDTGINGGHICRKCAEDELKKAAFALSSLGKTLSGQTFENFELKYYSDKGNPSPLFVMKKNLDACRSFCRDFRQGDSLFMTGGTGLGKTHLSSAIAHELINKGVSVCYVTAPELFERLESVRFGREDAQDTKEFDEADLLIIDDLGSEVITSFTVSALFSIVNGRINAGRSMIISTNFSPADIEKNYNDKITSRLMGAAKTLFFIGDDIRIAKRLEKQKANKK